MHFEVIIFRSYPLFPFQLPVVKELGEEAFSYVFEGSELLAKLTEGLDPVECKIKFFLIAI
jgi:hypothetical protein